MVRWKDEREMIEEQGNTREKDQRERKERLLGGKKGDKRKVN